MKFTDSLQLPHVSIVQRMHLSIVILFCLYLVVGRCQDDSEESSEEVLANGEKKISENILAILEHFKKPDPVGLPGADVPEPLPVPDTKQTLNIATIHFKNTAVYGISKFRILYINAEMSALEVQAAMSIDRLQARGNYTMSAWLSRAQGPFTVDITGLIVHAKAGLGVERDGKLRAQGIDIDLSFSTISVNFENLGMLGSLFQGLINSAGNIIFESIKPFILKEAYVKARSEINSKLENFAGDMEFPNSISPLDMIVTDVRKKLRDSGLDPYKVKDYNTTVSLFTVSLSNTWINGVSSVQRVGNITLKMKNKTAIADFEIGTQRLEGRTQWEISAIHGLASRAGFASFSVEYITARFVIGQPLDTREKIQFRDIELEIGNIQVRFDGTGTLDYAVEFVVNVLPNLLRYQIMDGIRSPLKEKIQKELNTINTEELIKAKLPEIDAMQQKGFKLSSLVNSDVGNQPYDEDDFFNF